MTKRSSAPARALAVVALIGGFIVFFVVLSAAMDAGDSDENGGTSSREKIERQEKRRAAPATYTVENGDTLTAIARETGVPVATILRLNPDVDPQILISGEKLKLK